MDLWISLSAYEVENPQLLGRFGRGTFESKTGHENRLRQDSIRAALEDENGETEGHEKSDESTDQESETVIPTLEDQRDARAEFFSEKDIDDTIREHEEAAHNDLYNK